MSKYGLKYDTIYISNNCREYKLHSLTNHMGVEIKFISTGTVKKVSAVNARRGDVRDKNYPTFFGVGSLGYGEFKTRCDDGSGNSSKTKAYQKWENMLARCYYEKTARFSAYGGVGVTVCKDWLNFQNFAKWFTENYVEGYHLDKDILNSGNKTYCPEHCRFVPQSVNGLLVNNTINVGKASNLPEGVSPSKDKGYYYQVCVSQSKYKKVNKRFVYLEDAMNYYQKEKTRVVNKAAEDNKHLIPNDVYEALRDYKFIYETEGK